MSTILVISPEHWTGHFVSKHHYAIELAKRGHEVIFLGPAEAGQISFEKVVRQEGEVTVLHAPSIARALRFLPAALRRLLEARWLQSVELRLGHRIDLVWLFENSRFYDMGFAGDRLKIYHQVDLNQSFHPKIAAATADLSIANSGPIEDLIGSAANKLLRVGHGCTLTQAGADCDDGLDEAFTEEVKHVVLTGNLSIKYLDIALLESLVSRHSDVRFHFVGKFQEGKGLHAAVGSRLNTVFWGFKPSEQLPVFLRRADVLLVAYLADQYLEQLANPHKIMEYLASGRCILATRTLEYEDRPELVEIAHDRSAYFQRFAEIIADPAPWNAPELVAKRRAYAADNTYPRQTDRIAEALGAQRALISRKDGRND